MIMKYLVSRQGQELEPQPMTDIVARVRNREVDLFDYIFDETRKEWVLLLEFGPLTEALKQVAPPPVAKKATSTPVLGASTGTPTTAKSHSPRHQKGSLTSSPPTEWFVLKGDSRLGPFSYTDVVKMLQEKTVYSYDFVWNEGWDNWKRISETSPFKEDSVRSLYTAGESKSVFTKREFNRQKFDGRVMIHDNLMLWSGRGTEISRGGVGITLKNAMMTPGQNVFVHFTGTQDWPAFNATCEVMNKKMSESRLGFEYGLKFLTLSQEAQDSFYKKVK